ncbi:MAG: hypothetical protein AAF125_20775 [Chloroflexota bacterium]
MAAVPFFAVPLSLAVEEVTKWTWGRRHRIAVNAHRVVQGNDHWLQVRRTGGCVAHAFVWLGARATRVIKGTIPTLQCGNLYKGDITSGFLVTNEDNIDVVVAIFFIAVIVVDAIVGVFNASQFGQANDA